MTKEEEINKVKRHLDQYRTIAEIQQQDEQLIQQYNSVVDRRNAIPPIRNEADDYGVSKGALLILSIVMFNCNAALSSFVLDGKTFDANIVSMIAALVELIVVPILAAYLILKLRVLKKRKKAQKLYEAKMENARKIDEKTNEICEQISCQQAELMKKRDAIAKQLKESPDSVIPEAYWCVADDICSLMENSRADSVKEAINLLEDIWHKNRLENAMAQNTYDYVPQDNSAELDLMQQQLEATKRHTQAVDNLRLQMFLRK